MNELQKFMYTDKEVRVIIKEGEPWFVGKDVAEVLGYKNTRKALSDHIDEEDKGVTKCYTLGGTQEMLIINESGVYSLILRSKIPSARQFKRWVTHDVIPAIRKHGGYLTPEATEKALHDPDFIIRLANDLKAERAKREALESENAVMLPKAEYCDAVLRSPTLAPVNMIAKDYGMSAVQFNKLLERYGIQYKRAGMWYLKKEYQDNDYLRSETFLEDGSMISYHWNKWTESGRKFLYEFLKAQGILPLSERTKHRWNTNVL